MARAACFGAPLLMNLIGTGGALTAPPPCAIAVTKPPADEPSAFGTTSREKRPRSTCTGKAKKPMSTYVSCSSSGVCATPRSSSDGASSAVHVHTTGPRRPWKRRSEAAPASSEPAKPPDSIRKRQRAANDIGSPFDSSRNCTAQSASAARTIEIAK